MTILYTTLPVLLTSRQRKEGRCVIYGEHLILGSEDCLIKFELSFHIIHVPLKSESLPYFLPTKYRRKSVKTSAMQRSVGDSNLHDRKEGTGSSDGFQPAQTEQYPITIESRPQSTEIEPLLIDTFTINPWLKFFGTSFLVLLLAVVFKADKPLQSLGSTFTVIFPSAIVIYLSNMYLKDKAVPSAFIWNQFLIAAMPFLVIVSAMQQFLAYTIAFLSMFSKIEEITELFQDFQEFEKLPVLNAVEKVMSTLFYEQRLALFILVTFFVKILIEEVAKWLLARRYRYVNDLEENKEKSRRISSLGAVHIAATGTVGFITIKTVYKILSPFELILFSLAPVPFQLSKALLNARDFVLHILTTSYVTLSSAQNTILGEKCSAMRSIVFVVVFRFVFENASGSIDPFTLQFNPILEIYDAYLVQFSLLMYLGFICIRKFKRIHEQEKMMAASGPFNGFK